MPSLHSRERGLKYKKLHLHRPNRPSLHSRERGLKLMEWVYDRTQADVAPLAGAWIEMLALQS